MTNDVEAFAIARQVLGDEFDKLLQVAIDIGTAPVFVMTSDEPRLVRIRDLCLKRLRESDVLFDCDGEFAWPSDGDRAQKLLVAALDAPSFSLGGGVFELPNPASRVLEAVPRLQQKMDKDGLLVLDDLEATDHGVFVDGYALHYHQLLRRYFTSGINYTLIHEIRRSGSEKGNKVRIAIDERRLRNRDEYRELIEKDYWRGPKLEASSLGTSATIGRTVHGDPEGGRSFQQPFVATAFEWSRKRPDSTEWTFEAEEARLSTSDDPSWVNVRYLHARLNVQHRHFVHVDGAVKGYLSSEYDVTEFVKAKTHRAPRYRKVFRLDGIIPADDWATITSHWFRGNPLVAEYVDDFDAKARA